MVRNASNSKKLDHEKQDDFGEYLAVLKQVKEDIAQASEEEEDLDYREPEIHICLSEADRQAGAEDDPDYMFDLAIASLLNDDSMSLYEIMCALEVTVEEQAWELYYHMHRLMRSGIVIQDIEGGEKVYYARDYPEYEKRPNVPASRVEFEETSLRHVYISERAILAVLSGQPKPMLEIVNTLGIKNIVQYSDLKLTLHRMVMEGKIKQGYQKDGQSTYTR